MQRRFYCNYCSTLKFGFFQYARHLTQYHESQSGFRIQCNFENCKMSYVKVASFRKHVVRCHRLCLSAESHNASKFASGTETDIADDYIQYSADMDEHEEMETRTSSSRCATMEEMVSRANSHCTSLVLSLREKHQLPSSVHSSVVSNVQHLLMSSLTDYKNVISGHLEKAGVVLNDELKTCLDIEKQCDSLGKHVESEFTLLRYLQHNQQIVMPRSVVIDDSKPKQTFQYVPILEVIGKVLSHADIVAHFRDRVSRSDNVLEDVCDGTVFKSDAFFELNPQALRIHLYTDEFEVCNPIGPKKGRHKMVGFYYTIGNFHPKFRSQTRFIFLAILVKYKYLQENGYSKILEPLINDLNLLQERGITMKTECGSQTYKGKLVSISADNLSAHAMAGFQQHFNSGRICRTCLADHDEIADKYLESDFKLRDADIHAYHIAAVELNPANAKVYGVKGPCALTGKLQDFDVTQQFPHDVMHDLLEGVLPLTTRLVLQHYITTKQCTLNDINCTLSEIQLAHSCNRPNQLTTASINSHITGTAIQKLELFLVLPRVLMPHVTMDVSDCVWSVYLLLRGICDIVLAPVVNADALTMLQELTLKYLSQYVQAFGKQHIIPKHHYMVHYARNLRMFGPLRNMWCMRFESKNKYFKDVALAVKNYINVSFTLAKRHQMRQCWEMSSEDILHSEEKSQSCKTVTFSTLPIDLQQCIENALSVTSNADENVASVSLHWYDGCCYKVGQVYVLSLCEEEEIPMFIFVKKILCFRSMWILCGSLLVPSEFVTSYHSYCVHEELDSTVVPIGHLPDNSMHDYFCKNNS